MKNKRMLLFGLMSLLIIALVYGCKDSGDYETSIEESEDELNTQPDVMKEDGLNVTVQFGFDKYVKSGRKARALVTVDNESNDFDGSVNFCFDNGNRATASYTQAFSVEANESTQIEMAIPAQSYLDELKFSVKDKNDQEVISKKIRVNVAYNNGTAYIGVLTNDTSKFSTLTEEEIRLFFLTKEDFPRKAEELDSLDGLVIDDYDLATLDEEQRKALEAFEKKHSVIHLDSDMDVEKSLEKTILDHLTVYSKGLLEKEKSNSNITQQAYSSSEIIDSEKLPAFSHYFIPILLYLIIIGPPLYFLLKKMKQSNLLWVMVPVLSVLFTLLIFLVGICTRLKEPFIGYLTISEIGEDTTNEDTFFSLTSPYNKPYELTTPKGYSLLEAENNSYNSRSYISNGIIGSRNSGKNTTIEETSNGWVLSVHDNAAFEYGYYQMQHTEKEGKKLESDLSVGEDYKVRGSVINTSGYDLTNVVICVGDIYVLLGDFANGEIKTVDTLEQRIMISAIDMYQSDILPKIAGGDPSVGKTSERISRVYYAYQYYLEDRMSSFQKPDTVMLGIRKDSEVPTGLSQTSYPKSGIQMITMETAVDYSDDGKIFVPNIDPYMKASDNYIFDVYRYMDGDTIKLTLKFDPQDKIDTLIYSKQMNNEFKDEAWNGFYGKLKAYNYETEHYDTIFISGKPKTLSGIEKYLGPNNIMSILIETSAAISKDRSPSVPVLSVIKEAK